MPAPGNSVSGDEMTSSGISSDFVQSPAAKPGNRSKPARESVDPSTSLAEEMVLDTLAEEAVLDTRLDHLMFLAAKILHELNSLHQQRQTHLTHRITFKDEVRRFESELIRNALAITSGAQRRAAAILGMNASTLDMTIKRLKINVQQDEILTDESASPTRDESDAEWVLGFSEAMKRFEVQMIIRALEQTGGHQTEAARLLQMPVTTLNDKIRRHGIDAAALSTRSLKRLFMVNRKTLAPQLDTEL